MPIRERLLEKELIKCLNKNGTLFKYLKHAVKDDMSSLLWMVGEQMLYLPLGLIEKGGELRDFLGR